jgi:ABC-type ATPase with predicted acetyltransferase domain
VKSANIDRRISNLEQYVSAGCDTCWQWQGYVIVGCDQDGNPIDFSEPPVCPDCGREIELQSETLLVGVTCAQL